LSGKLGKEEEEVDFLDQIERAFKNNNEENKQESKQIKQKEKNEKEATYLVQNGFIIHKVLNTDTLQGLAIKYNVSVQDIKNANKLMNNNISIYNSLKIPPKKK